MSIAVECPHCESRFTLQPELLGKSMRCPDCRDVFTVSEVPPVPVLPTLEPLPSLPYLSGSVNDFVPLLEIAAPPKPVVVWPYEKVEPASLPYVLEPDIVPTVPTLKPPPIPAMIDAESFDESIDDLPPGQKMVDWNDAPTGPKVVDWRDDAPKVPVLKSVKERPIGRDDFDPDDLPKASGAGVGRWGMILAGLIVTIFGVLIYAGVSYYRNEQRSEEYLAKEADDEFKLSNHAKSAQLYEKLLTDFPVSEKKDTYQFFAKLAALHSTVTGTTVRDNPADGIAKFRGFLTEYGSTAMAKPDASGYGHEIFEAGRKLVDGVVEHADDRLKKYVSKRKNAGGQEELTGAEKAVEEGRSLIPLTEKYKIKEVKALDEPRKRFDELTGKFVRERERLAVFAPFRDLPTNPTDQRIAAFAGVLKRARFDSDTEGLEIIADAKAALRRLIQPVLVARLPVPYPNDPSGGLLIVAPPVGQTTAPLIPLAPDAITETFYAVARGILHAFDADNGTLLWAARIGRYNDVPVRVPLAEGGGELAIVPTEIDGQYGLTARLARTGQIWWYQPLEAECAGRPIVVGSRVYVPIRDELGTVIELEAVSGNRLSHIQLRQRIGPGAVRQPGTGMLYVAAEARRVFAIDVEPHNAENDRLPMRCVQVLATEHPDLSLRVPPIITGPVGEEKANRYIILTQNDGTQATKLRAFPLTTMERGNAADGPPEIAPVATTTLSLPGHVWFPPHTDGERVAIVTDAGAFGLFGTNQLGNQDAGMYAIPGPQLPVDAKNPSAGQIAIADDDTFWTISRSKLFRMRLGFTAQNGLQVTPAGLPVPSGVPMQSPQWNARRDTAFVAVRSEESDGMRAIAFDVRDGRPRWHRKLGAIPSVPPVPTATGAILVDEDGGVYAIPLLAALSANDATKPIEPAWIVAPPVVSGTAPAKMATSLDGKTTWILVPEKEPGEKAIPQLRVRQIVEGKAKTDALAPLPDRLAGSPVAVGASVVFPLADGFLYRFEPGNPKLVQGPMWRGDGATADAICYLTPVSDEEYLSTDGNKKVVRTRWPSTASAEWKTAAGPWVLREKIAIPPAIVAVGDTSKRVLIADGTGSVWMFDADQTGEPLSRWRGNATEPVANEVRIPAGKPTGRFLVSTNTDGTPFVIYTVNDRHIVGLTPNSETAAWVIWRTKDDDLLGMTTSRDAILTTDVTGTVTAFRSKTGDKIGSVKPESKSIHPRTHAIPFGPGKLLMPASDGSAVILGNPA